MLVCRGGVINQNHISNLNQFTIQSGQTDPTSQNSEKKLIQATKTPLIQAVPLYKSQWVSPPPLRNTALHSDETRPMAQFFSPASTFLGKNYPEDWPHGSLRKMYTSNGPIIFVDETICPIHSPKKYSPYGACKTEIRIISNSGKCLRSIREKLIFGGCTPFFSTKKKSPNITTPQPPKKKTTPRKKNWNQPSKSTTSTSTNSWRVAHQSDALRFDSHEWIVQYSTGVASGGLASNKYSPPKQRTEKWRTASRRSPKTQTKRRHCPRMKNWMVKTHVDDPFQISRKETYENPHLPSQIQMGRLFLPNWPWLEGLLHPFSGIDPIPYQLQKAHNSDDCSLSTNQTSELEEVAPFS